MKTKRLDNIPEYAVKPEYEPEVVEAEEQPEPTEEAIEAEEQQPEQEQEGDGLSDLFRVTPEDVKGDVEDLIEVTEEDVFGDGGDDFSDLVDVSDDDIFGPKPEPRQRIIKYKRTRRPYTPPNPSMGGMRL